LPCWGLNSGPCTSVVPLNYRHSQLLLSSLISSYIKTPVKKKKKKCQLEGVNLIKCMYGNTTMKSLCIINIH
jgi:hypothetical protein